MEELDDIMEELEGIMDKKTLKSRYLFPATPVDSSMCEAVLWDQLTSCPSREAARMFAIGVGILDHTVKVGDILDNETEDCDFTWDFLELYLEVFRLFRIDKREVDYTKDIKGKKHIMACIISVPDVWESPVWHLSIISHGLYAQRDDVELIIFLRKRSNGSQEFASFDDFLEPFHPSCIAVGLQDDVGSRIFNRQVLVIDPEGTTLVRRFLDFVGVGPAAFPFTEESVQRVYQQLRVLDHSSLETLLGVEPSYELFRKLPGTDPLQEERRCISEFRSKVVLLYTYFNGHYLSTLCKAVKDLVEMGMEFEVITAHVPVLDFFNSKEFLEVFSSLVAQQHELSWWVLPYDCFTYFRLRFMYSYGNVADRLIAFDPNDDDGGDPHGMEILSLYGPSMFPFYKKSVVERVRKDLSQVTLQSLLEHVTYLYEEYPDCDNNDVYDNKSHRSLLDGKNVLVFFDTAMSKYNALDQFVPWYNSLADKENRPYNFEVVCVYLDFPKQHEYSVDMRREFPKWLISCDDEEKACTKHVSDNFFLKLFKHKFSTIVAFGIDGKISSLCAHRLLSSSEAVTFPLSGDLPNEFFNILNEHCSKRYGN